MPQSQVISVDAPVGGWNVFDSLDNMPPTDAVILDNMIPGAGTVDTRLGSIEFADTGTGEPVETVAALDTDSSSMLLAASDGGIWDVTGGVVSELHAASTYTNDRWQHRNFRKADEEGILIMCNGADTVQIFATPYAALTNASFSGDTPATTFIGVEVFKGRAYYWADNDDSFYYAAAGAYQGAMARFPLGAFVQRGGKIVMMTTWTQQDSGDGKDDFLVIVFSTGEILIYQGDDPGGVGFFEIVGRYMTAEPLSIRGNDKYGSDTIIMTKDGYVSLATLVQEGRISDVPAFSRLIHGAIVERTKTRADLNGWDCMLFPKQGLFVFNVPLSEQTFEQHVLNTVTQRWCRFKAINVNSLEVHEERLFGGAFDGTVIAMLEGTSDLGDQIEFTALPAFNYLGDAGNHKHITAAQIISTHTNPGLITLSGQADFTFPTATTVSQVEDITSATWSVNPPAPPAAVGSLWDTDYWSAEGDIFTTKGWQNISAFGYAVSVLVRFAKINEGVSWRSTGLRFYKAGAN